MDTDPPSDVMRVWVRLLRIEQRVRKTVETELKSAGLPTLVWYDVLLELERAGDAGLRQREIQQHTLLERYNVSRLVDRLRDAGLVKREPAADDGRGSVVHITSQGRALRAAMWPVYSQSVEGAFSAQMSEQDRSRLLDLLECL